MRFLINFKMIVIMSIAGSVKAGPGKGVVVLPATERLFPHSRHPRVPAGRIGVLTVA
ncbi:hypothetical protein GIY56_00730 [Paracoccus sp. YIM 132242]|uniref:Uncharacterized protein n=1 Tax=Paracoccus lichenicola TaxID=2665644 RepID=A0A6L6HNB3_9RHOB|nr:hypothetical protein [Paracoccus lichenicola]MTD98807.1 hypothetical protein [Paracoccus lichenicola]